MNASLNRVQTQPLVSTQNRCTLVTAPQVGLATTVARPPTLVYAMKTTATCSGLLVSIQVPVSTIACVSWATTQTLKAGPVSTLTIAYLVRVLTMVRVLIYCKDTSVRAALVTQEESVILILTSVPRNRVSTMQRVQTRLLSMRVHAPQVTKVMIATLKQ